MTLRQFLNIVTLSVYALITWRFIKKHVPIKLKTLEIDLEIFSNRKRVEPLMDVVVDLLVDLWDISIVQIVSWGYWVVIGASCLVSVNWPDSPMLIPLSIFILISVTAPGCMLVSLFRAVRMKKEVI